MLKLYYKFHTDALLKIYDWTPTWLKDSRMAVSQLQWGFTIQAHLYLVAGVRGTLRNTKW